MKEEHISPSLILFPFFCLHHHLHHCKSSDITFMPNYLEYCIGFKWVSLLLTFFSLIWGNFLSGCLMFFNIWINCLSNLRFPDGTKLEGGKLF
ncbi:hypothetical protein L1887_20936 [Cichorium endivia]|nr:hypothetical protein L1887_20936 [Cichorium endivia]